MIILVVLILPMPAALLDLLLAVSITFSILILMTALFIHRPLEFSSFPTILLIATMMRLSLNLASTRLILSNGHEGTDAAGRVKLMDPSGATITSNGVTNMVQFGRGKEAVGPYIQAFKKSGK